MTTLARASSINAAPPPTATHVAGIASHGRGLCIVVILLAAQAPLWMKLGVALWQRPQYQFFPLMLAGAALLAWERWRDLPREDRERLQSGAPGVALALAVGSLGALVLGGVFLIRSMALVSTLFMLAAFAWRAGGGRLLRAMTPPLILLAVLIPPPGHLDEALTLRLQHLAVNGSGRLLDALHVVHVQSGNVLEIPGRQLLIEQACSGINSLISICGFALLLGFYRGRRAGHVALLLPGAFVFVIGANVLRITIEAWLKVRCGIDVLDGARHETLGMLLFLICAGLVVSFDELLTMLLPPRRRRSELASPAGDTVAAAAVADSATAEYSRPPGTKTAAIEWLVAGSFLLAGLFVWTQVSDAWPAPSIRDDAVFHLPSELAGWRQLEGDGASKDALTAPLTAPATIERPQVLAAKSSVWRFRRDDDGLLASVALDYPFVGYHDLSSCYALAGWSIDQRSSENVPPLGFAKIRMSKSSVQQGELLYGLLCEDGKWLPATPPNDAAAQAKGVGRALAVARRDATGRPTYQVQVFVQSYSPLSPSQQQGIEDLFREASQALAQETLGQLESHR